MTAYIVFVAMAVAAIVLARRGAQAAFLYVWIPVFLAFPSQFRVNIPGLPDPSFMQAAILPILFVLLRDRLGSLNFGRMEALLLAYVVWRVGADFLSRGYADAQNYLFYMLSALVGPYMLGRYLIDRRAMDVAVARMFVLMFLLFFPLFLYELRFWVSPIYKFVAPLFPGSFSGLSLRWGMARTAGTFEHPILACIMVVIVYRLHRWLCWSDAWRPPQTGLLGHLQRLGAHLPFSFQQQIGIVLILMALMTISRGPWIGALAAALLVAAGNTRQRLKWLVIVLVGLAAGALLGQEALDAYVTPELGEVLSGEAKTMLYRMEMIEQYKAFLLERLWTGWGLTDVPKIRGMESVDNAFFLMALQHGLVAPVIFVLMFLYAIASQLKFGIKASPGESPIGFTFAGIYLMCFVSFATVYMGAQTEPMLFLLLGWGESIKRRRGEVQSGVAPVPTVAKPFRRVLT